MRPTTMSKDFHIYAVIIGSEILNRKRQDKHFEHLSQVLAKKGHTLFSSFVLKDDAKLMEDVYKLVKNDDKSIMFSFGGIGSTPDDLTREISAKVFTDGVMQRNKQFEQDILKRIGERAYPHPIKMSDLPAGATLLHNPINNMSGYALENRFFFMPGFPEMAHPMCESIIEHHITTATKMHTKSFLAETGEGILIELMKNVPKEIELSSLPMMNNGNPKVEFSLSHEDDALLSLHFQKFTDFLDANSISYRLL